MPDLPQPTGGSEVRNSPFPATRWSVVVAAAGPRTPTSAEALEHLCQAYWYPLYAFARRYGKSPSDAQDLVQGFFLHWFESGLVEKANRQLGKFRSFLLASFKNFIASEQARVNALKRGGRQTVVNLDSEEAEVRFARELATEVSPETLYDRSWAMAVLEQAMKLLESEFSKGGRTRLFEELHPFLQGDRGPLSYAEIAQRLGTTEGTIKVTVNRMRQRYREFLRAVIAETVGTASAVEEELGELVAILKS
jgi:RNA polymerase sigma factor (sigma-70 family)